LTGLNFELKIDRISNRKSKQTWPLKFFSRHIQINQN
jgi:hypothetical protein